MRSTKQLPVYTAKEVVEILQKAKELGVISLRLPGFSAGWNVQDDSDSQDEEHEPESALPPASSSKPDSRSHYFEDKNRNQNETCWKCGDAMSLGNWGLFCKSCYAERKSQNQKRWGNWRR